jgi:purine nucleoside permease
MIWRRAAYGPRPPAVEACDVDADDTYWAGASTSRFVSWWVREWTNGAGRGSSDYNQPYHGSTPQAALAGIDRTGGFELALENVYRAGEPVVRALRDGTVPR